MQHLHAQNEIVIIYDTLCGWCYGAAPIFDAIVNTGAAVEVLHRHLFQGDAAPRMSEGKGKQILRTIPDIEAIAGQSFSEQFKQNIAQSKTEVLSSGLSAQAAALIHDQGPKKEFALRKRIETAHFKNGVSSNNREVVVDALLAEGVSVNDTERLGTADLQAQANAQEQRARSLMAAVGSSGVPTVIKVRENRITRLDHQVLYGRPEAMTNGVQRFIDCQTT